MAEPSPAIHIRSLSKSYGGVRALSRVSFSVEEGTIHALIGENGAGKSTLLKILTGVERADEGDALIHGLDASSTGGEKAAVAMIFQEMSLIPSLTAAENIFLAREPKNRLGLLDHRAIRNEARRLLGELAPDLDPDRPVGRLNTGQRQIVEIAKALSRSARVLILDEPTAALSQIEVERLFTLLRRLRDRGVTIIYVSHKMDEIERLAEQVTVLRDGRHIHTGPKAGLAMTELIELMIGKKVAGMAYAPKRIDRGQRPRLSVNELRSVRRARRLSFDVWPGEILGIAGALGSGRSSLARMIAGLERPAAGRVRLDGADLAPGSSEEAFAAGLALVPEDRRTQGLSLAHSASFNLTLPTIDRLARGPFLHAGALQGAITPIWSRLNIRAASPDQKVASLSGGNQQKIVIAKWLLAKPKVLILDEPTAGIDILSKLEILNIIREYAETGLGIIFISSELPELIAASDRLLVMTQAGGLREIKREDMESWTSGIEGDVDKTAMIERELIALMYKPIDSPREMKEPGNGSHLPV